MKNCNNEKGDVAGDYTTMYIVLHILNTERIKTTQTAVKHDVKSLRDELLRYCDEPLYFEEVLNDLQFERHINIFEPTLSQPNGVVKLDDLYAYEITMYKESDYYKDIFCKANKSAGRELSKDDFFRLGYDGASQLKLMLAYNFFVSFVPEMRDEQNLERYNVTILNNED